MNSNCVINYTIVIFLLNAANLSHCILAELHSLFPTKEGIGNLTANIPRFGSVSSLTQNDNNIVVLASKEISCHSCIDTSILNPECMCESVKCVIKTSNKNSTKILHRTCSEEKWSYGIMYDGCLDYQNEYVCFCSGNFCNGKNISLIRGEPDCNPNQCPSGSICFDTFKGYECLCPPWNPSCSFRKKQV